MNRTIQEEGVNMRQFKDEAEVLQFLDMKHKCGQSYSDCVYGDSYFEFNCDCGKRLMCPVSFEGELGDNFLWDHDGGELRFQIGIHQAACASHGHKLDGRDVMYGEFLSKYNDFELRKLYVSRYDNF